MNVFKTYDIRGFYPEEVNEKLFYKIGQSIKKLKIKEIAIGRDARLSSNSLFSAFSKGLMDSGVNVIDLGVITSPMLSFYCASKKKMGSMITASHNPREYNGIKFVDALGIQQSYDKFLKKIKKVVNKKQTISSKKGKMQYYDMLRDYTLNIQQKLTHHFIKHLTIVFDCSNGTGGIPLLSALPLLNIKPIIINDKPDGNFPSHSPDQTKKENLVQLQKEVLRSKADLGVIFDGDADRCGFVDEKGQIVPIDMAFLLLALRETRKSKVQYPKVLFDLRFSKATSEFIEDNFGTPIVMRVGNPFHKEYLHKDKKAIMAGEYSGHIMYKHNYSIDDALYAAIKMIELLSKNEKKLSELVENHRKYASTGEISVKVKNPSKVIKFIEKNYKKEKKSKIDGLSISKPEVWFNIRKSNTEDLVRFEIEGISLRVVEQERRKIELLIKKGDKK